MKSQATKAKMTEPHEITATTLDPPGSPELTPETASRTAILITAPEVVFSTVAAVPVQPTPTRWWIVATRVGAAALHRMFLPTPPPRSRYLDDAVIAREMHRL
jgi:hypothetical protein